MYVSHDFCLLGVLLGAFRGMARKRSQRAREGEEERRGEGLRTLPLRRLRLAGQVMPHSDSLKFPRT